jgi:TetR/AcrR family tetracycline transcriptional repressor
MVRNAAKSQDAKGPEADGREAKRTAAKSPRSGPAVATDAEAGPPKRRQGRPAVGRDEPLERDEILDRAYAIINAEGIDALSMRRLAKELGVTPMAIYHHVPNKPALLQALIDRIWQSIFVGVETEPADLVEWIVDMLLRTRRVWLENVELANLAMAVAEFDEQLIDSSLLALTVFRGAGFPEPPFAFNALQIYTMGAVATAANRKMSTAYFGRDEKAILAKARRVMRARKASPAHLAIIEARFDKADEEYFERGLRALVAGLLAGDS